MRFVFIFVFCIFGMALSNSAIAKSCSSDFNCSMGEVCVKAPYKTRGTCMTAVNELGRKTYQRPSTDSIYPGSSQGGCKFSTDCPIGFKCDRRLKACIKR